MKPTRRSALVIGLFVGATLGPACNRGKPDNDEAPKAASPEGKGPARTAAGDPIVRLDPAAQARIGIRTQVVSEQMSQPELVAFGRLEEDPSRAFVVRAPVAGTLHAAAGREWPSLGQALADHAIVG